MSPEIPGPSFAPLRSDILIEQSSLSACGFMREQVQSTSNQFITTPSWSLHCFAHLPSENIQL